MKGILIGAIVVLIVAVAVYAFSRVQALRQQREMQAALADARTFPKDFSTPEGAILCLEEAYRRRDLEAAVACKDFRAEAKLMLQQMGKGMDADEEIVKQTAEVLELSFRKHTVEEWPDFNGVQSFFPRKEPQAGGVVAVTEVCRLPDGSLSQQRLLAAQTPKGWRVLNPVDK